MGGINPLHHFRSYFFFLLLCCVVHQSAAFFCSAYCKPNFCTGKLSTQCTACSPPFTLQANSTCTLDPNSGYVFFEDENQIVSTLGGTISCGIYTFDGTYVTSTIGLRSAGAITFPHFSVRLIAWVILYNEWDPLQDLFRGVLNTTGQQVTQPVSSYSTAEPLCSTAAQNEWYMKLEMEFAHNQLVNRIRVDLSNTNVLSKSWGIKEYMYIVATCHAACQVCNDATALNCSTCSTGYFLSGTVCNQSCVYRYGSVSSSQTCVACSPYCIACQQLATNCSACQTTGTYESFLTGTTCAATCPSRFTPNTSSHLCVPCTSGLCLICTIDSPSNCLTCQTGSFWLNFECYTTCPNGYYPVAPNCTACDPSCATCTNSPSPCSVCSSNYFLYASQCSTTCPAGYFGHVPSKTCLACAGYCVTATATMSLGAGNSTMVTKITFSKQIDFSTFPFSSFQSLVVMTPGLSIDSFSQSYKTLDSYSFSITLAPKSTINMSDVNFSMIINPNSIELFSVEGYPFDLSVYTVNSSILWSLIKLPQLTDNEKQIIQKLQTINTNINNALNGVVIQQVKKLGVFAYVFTGAQLCSLVVLHNSRPVQNSYEAARLWASFIYFEVPKWEQDSTYTKYVGSKQVSDLLPALGQAVSSQQPHTGLRDHRLLQSTSTAENWRFTRTGHTQIMLFDCYLIIALLVASWVVLLVVRLCSHRLHINTRSIFYNALHKIHEISLFFITLSVVLQWVTLPTKSSSTQYQGSLNYVYASFGLSIVAAIYFLAYEVYIFYTLIPYGSVEAGSKKYRVYLERFSYFLRDIRFTESANGLNWTYRELVKPHNYQILSCIRLVLLVCAMPIFHAQPFAAITVLLAVQLIQTVRFIITWPYHSLVRNCVKLTLQIALLLVFAVHMCTYIMFQIIYQNLNNSSETYMKIYFFMGWTGFALIFFYNLVFIGYQIGDVVVGCRRTNQQRMEYSRKEYYYKMLDQFEQKMFKDSVKQDIGSNTVVPKPGKQIMEDSSLKNRRKQFGKGFNISLQIANKLYENYGRSTSALPANPALHALTMKSIIPEYDLHDSRSKNNQLMSPDSLPMKNRRRIEQIINKGNLDGKQYGDYPIVYVTIEHYVITYTEKEYKYNVKVNTVPAVFMRQKISPESKDNLLIPQRNTKQIALMKSMNHEYFFVIDEIFKTFGSVTTESITIKTNLKVDQNLYKPSQQVPHVESTLSQWIELKNHNGCILKQKLEVLLPGFPIPSEIIAAL